MFSAGFPQPRGKDGSGGVGWQELADTTLTVDQAINTMLTFAGLANYRMIRVVFSTRSGAAADNFSIRFNGDLGTKYNQQTLENVVNSSGTTLTGIPIVRSLPVPASQHNIGYIDIINFPDKVKTLISFSTTTAQTAGSVPNMLKTHGNFHDTTAAIDTLSIYSTAQPIQAGSRFTIYGLK